MNFAKQLAVCIMTFVLFLTSGTALGGSPPCAEEVTRLKQATEALMERVRRLEEEVKKYKETAATVHETQEEQANIKKHIDEIEKHKDLLGHLEISGGVTTVVQATSGNDDNAPNYDDAVDGAFTIDLNLATHLEDYGSFYVHLEGGNGGGIQDHVASFSVPNYDAYDTKNASSQSDVTISEAFYEFSFLDDKLVLDAGKMDISVLFDENEAAGDETSQFLSNIFVKSMGLTIPEPDNFYAPALVARVTPMDLVEFTVIGASVEDDNWDHLFEHGFVATQVALRPTIMGRRGNYRLYGWWDGRKHLKNQDLATANARTTPVYNDNLADQAQKGWGVSFDQEFAEGVKGFVRYSQTEDDLSRWDGDSAWELIPFDKLWTLGLELSGGLWQRENDAIGVAFGQTLLTDAYQQANVNSDDEGYGEAYYRLALEERFSISGDLQWVQNAGGHSEADDVYIFGIRAQLDF